MFDQTALRIYIYIFSLGGQEPNRKKGKLFYCKHKTDKHSGHSCTWLYLQNTGFTGDAVVVDVAVVVIIFIIIIIIGRSNRARVNPYSFLVKWQRVY